MKWLTVSALMFATACAFHAEPPELAAGDGSGSELAPGAPDGPVTGMTPENPDDVVNVAPADQAIGAGDLHLGDEPTGDEITIDTTALVIRSALRGAVALPPGVAFAAVACDGCRGELGLLRVHDLTMEGTIHVTGARPLVILTSSVQTSAELDVTAHGSDADGADGADGADDDNVLSSNRGGALEIFGLAQVANSGDIVAGTGGGAAHHGAIVLQGGRVVNTGRLAAGGHIILLYKDAVTEGIASPRPEMVKYGEAPRAGS